MESFLTNINPRVNGIQSIGVKENLVIGTLGANPTSIIGENPTIAIGVDITKMDTISNPKQHGGERGGHAIKAGNTRGWKDASKIT
jgi:hypothetical protein